MLPFGIYKSLHIIFVTTWFAGLFYIVRLFIYHTEAQDRPPIEREILSNQFKIMEKRLWYAITWPSAVLTPIFGAGLLYVYFPLTGHPWLMAKLGLVFLLYLYHFSCGHILKKLKNNHFDYTSFQLRLWNEVPTIFLFSIVFLVILQDTLEASQSVAALLILIFILAFAVRLYKKFRQRSK